MTTKDFNLGVELERKRILKLINKNMARINKVRLDALIKYKDINKVPQSVKDTFQIGGYSTLQRLVQDIEK